MKRIDYQKDFYSRKARAEGIRARSYYKLAEIDKKYHLIKKAQVLLDLGAAPGGWCQYVLAKTSGEVTMVAVDCEMILPFLESQKQTSQSRVFLWQRDVLQLDFTIDDKHKIFLDKSEQKFDGILSDLSPNLTGIADVDDESCLTLAKKVISLTEKYLKIGGFLIFKSFQSKNSAAINKLIKGHFTSVKNIKPLSSNNKSREFFLFGKKN